MEETFQIRSCIEILANDIIVDATEFRVASNWTITSTDISCTTDICTVTHNPGLQMQYTDENQNYSLQTKTSTIKFSLL